MRKFLILGVALASISVAAPALAQSDNTAEATVGVTAGGATGGTIGFLLGGPVGAIIGGWAGAVIGGEAAVSADSVAYAGNNPVDPIYLDADIGIGYTVGNDVVIHPIEGDAQYGYIYADNRVWIVDTTNREIVQSPGYALPQSSVTYAQDNRVDSFAWNGDLTVGVTLDNDVTVQPIPDSGFSYAYINDRPVIIDGYSRTVVWIG
ncbi:DUF1236 domain-containing protein [Devosia sp.]|uniref:DUF1236 domain-containing protein n=1 Tax=Devosia sp. TaxID=1871048 RepID=UPI003A940D05